jgi:heptaprenyl diphosphate synthase
MGVDQIESGPRLQRATPPKLDRLTEEQLREVTDGLEDEPVMIDAVRYVLTGAGKQLRAGLCLEAAKYGPDPRAAEVWDVALALELFHGGSLAHDDIVDRGEMRRGWEALFKRDGTCTAGVVASWMYARAVGLVTGTGDGAAAMFLGELRELCDGQLMDALDVFDVERTRERYMTTIDKKTSSLFRAAAGLGALAAGADEETVAGLRTYAHHLGLVFQMSDDILDIAGTEEALGKPPGSDLKEGVYTLPVIYAMETDPTLPNPLPQAASDERVLAHVVDTIVEVGALERAFADCAEEHERAAAALSALEVDDPSAVERLTDILDYSLERARPVVA